MTQLKNTEKVSFKIQGMSCSSCSAIIEKKLRATKGVINASINFAAEKAQVEFEKERINIEKLTKIIEDLGYKAILEEQKNIEKVTLKIKGMSCTACASQIEKSLSKVEGITAANVNFAVEKVTVEYNPKKIRLIDMHKKVSSLGYELDLEEDQDDNIDEDELKMNKAKKTMITSSIFTSAIMGLMVIHMFVSPIPGYLPIIAVLEL